MRYAIFLFVFNLFSGNLLAQHPIETGVCIPVFLQDVRSPQEHSDNLTPITALSGIAFLFLDTTKTQEELIVAGLEDPLIWYDRMGVSSQVQFISADSATNSRIELLFSNETCSALITKEGFTLAKGSVSKEKGEYVMRLVGNEDYKDSVAKIIDDLNFYLMRLYDRQMKKLPISPFFHRDSLNVIVGFDESYDTNYDVLWFDETLRNRVNSLAAASYNRITSSGAPIADTLKNAAVVIHHAEKVKSEPQTIRGKLSTVFEVAGNRGYLFLQGHENYSMEIDYQYKKWLNEADRLSITKFTIRNMTTQDFVEMEVEDFVDSGFPALYVDLINGVVMEDSGAWQVNQILQVIQDIFRLVRLPGESTNGG